MTDPCGPYAVLAPPRWSDEPDWTEPGYDEGRYPMEPHDEWSSQYPRDADDLGMLTEVVFVEGHLVDTRRRPVRGSGYEDVAELMAARRPPPRVSYVQVPAPPHHEPMLAWLDRVVGGRRALLDLDDLPLPAEDLDPAAFRSGDLPRLVEIDARIGRAMARLLSGTMTVELRTAVRRLMGRLLSADRRYLARSERDDLIAAGLFLAAARANHLVGADRPILSRSVTEAFDLASSPTSRASSIIGVVGGRAWWYDSKPHGAPDVAVLGHSGLLVSSFRRELLAARDLALAAANAAAADATAAGATAAGATAEQGAVDEVAVDEPEA